MSDAIALIEFAIVGMAILVPLFVFLERDNKAKSYDEQKKEFKKLYGIKEKKSNKYWHFKI